MVRLRQRAVPGDDGEPGRRRVARSSTARRHGSPSGRRPAPGPPRRRRLRRLQQRLPAPDPTSSSRKRSATSSGPRSANSSARPPADRPGHQPSHGEGALEGGDRGHQVRGGARAAPGRSRRRGCGPRPPTAARRAPPRGRRPSRRSPRSCPPRQTGRTRAGRSGRRRAPRRSRAVRRNASPPVERPVDEHHLGGAAGLGGVVVVDGEPGPSSRRSHRSTRIIRSVLSWRGPGSCRSRAGRRRGRRVGSRRGAGRCRSPPDELPMGAVRSSR